MVQVKGFRGGTTAIDGASLYYEIAGEGPDLVLAHASVFDLRMWDEQFPLFAQHYRVVRYDRRGSGKSEAIQGTFSHRNDLLQLLKHLGIQRTHLIGCSGGGGVILDFALEHPEMAASLVLISSDLGGYQMQGEMPKPLQELFAALQENDLDRAAELAVRIWIDGPRRTPDKVNASIRERGREMGKTALPSAFIPDEALTPPAIDRLNDLIVPTMVILGEMDDPSIHAIGDVLATKIRGAQKVVIPGTAHMLNLEKPDEFNRVVLEFLKQSTS